MGDDLRQRRTEQATHDALLEGDSTITRRTIVALGKILKAPFWFTWLTPAVFGYFASADGSPQKAGLFFFLLFVLCAAEAVCNLHNELVDQEEDQINQPHRAGLMRQLVAAVGEPRLWQIVVGGYAITSLAVILFWVEVNAAVALSLVYLGVHAILYNVGLHLKRRPGWAELTIGIAGLCTFLLGWAWHAPVRDMPVEGWILAYFMGITVFSKDLPDAKGDEAINVKSVFSIRTPRRLQAMLGFIYLSPYALIAGLVAAGAAPARNLWMLVLMPVAAWFAMAAGSLRSGQAKLAAYQVAFVYSHIFLLALFVISVHTAGALAAAAALLAIRMATLALRLDPRLVEPDFSSWPDALRHLATEQPLRLRST